MEPDEIPPVTDIEFPVVEYTDNPEEEFVVVDPPLTTADRIAIYSLLKAGFTAEDFAE